jgi:hypothetical protein
VLQANFVLLRFNSLLYALKIVTNLILLHIPLNFAVKGRMDEVDGAAWVSPELAE